MGVRMILHRHLYRHRWRLLLVVAAVLLPASAVTLAGLPWREALDSAAAVQRGWLMVAICANFAVFPLWACQWCLLAPPVRPIRPGVMLEIVALVSATQNTLPFPGGPVAATVLLATRGGVGGGEALSMLAMDQLATGIAKLMAIACALALVPLPAAVRHGAALMLIAVAVLCAGLLALAHGGEHLQRLAIRGPGFLRGGTRAVADWTRSLQAMRHDRRAAAVIVLAVGKKALEVAAALAVQQCCGLPPSPAAAVAVVAALGVSTMVPVTPANLGVYETTVFLIYKSLGISSASAFTAAVLQHFAFLLPAVGAGYLLLLRRALWSPGANEHASLMARRYDATCSPNTLDQA